MNCPVCEKYYLPKTKSQKYCCSICQQRGWRRTKAGISLKNQTRGELFWSHVDKTETCWNWTGAKKEWGHGVFNNGGVNVSAYRFSWNLVNGPVPSGFQLNHKCDNASCVNPEHLYLGTQQENIHDAKERGRMKFIAHKGEKNGNSKLDRQKVLEIRQKYQGAITQESLAKEYKVCPATIWNIVSNRTWR